MHPLMQYADTCGWFERIGQVGDFTPIQIQLWIDSGKLGRTKKRRQNLHETGSTVKDAHNLYNTISLVFNIFLE